MAGVSFENLKPGATSCLLFHLHMFVEAVNSPAASSSCRHSCCLLQCFPHDGHVYPLEPEAQVNSSSVVVLIVYCCFDCGAFSLSLGTGGKNRRVPMAHQKPHYLVSLTTVIVVSLSWHIPKECWLVLLQPVANWFAAAKTLNSDQLCG